VPTLESALKRLGAVALPLPSQQQLVESLLGSGIERRKGLAGVRILATIRLSPTCLSPIRLSPTRLRSVRLGPIGRTALRHGR